VEFPRATNVEPVIARRRKSNVFAVDRNEEAVILSTGTVGVELDLVLGSEVCELHFHRDFVRASRSVRAKSALSIGHQNVLGDISRRGHMLPGTLDLKVWDEQVHLVREDVGFRVCGARCWGAGWLGVVDHAFIHRVPDSPEVDSIPVGCAGITTSSINHGADKHLGSMFVVKFCAVGTPSSVSVRANSVALAGILVGIVGRLRRGLGGGGRHCGLQRGLRVVCLAFGHGGPDAPVVGAGMPSGPGVASVTIQDRADVRIRSVCVGIDRAFTSPSVQSFTADTIACTRVRESWAFRGLECRNWRCGRLIRG